MATQPASASEFQELVARYEALEEQAHGLLNALSRGRTIRNILLVALIAMVAVLAYTLYTTGKRLTSEDFITKLTDEGMKRLQANGGQLEKEARLLFERSSPILSKALQTQMEKDQPKYVKNAEKEWEPFKKDVEKQVTVLTEAHYKTMLGKCRKPLEKIIPEVATDPALFARVENGLMTGARDAVQKQIGGRIEPGFIKVEGNWGRFPSAPAPKDGEPSVMAQIAGHLLEFVSAAMTNGDALASVYEGALPGSSAGKAPPKKAPPPKSNPTPDLKKAPEAKKGN